MEAIIKQSYAPNCSDAFDLAMQELEAKNYDLAFSAFSELASLGDFTAKYHLAKLFSKGLGCSQDIGRAIELYKESASHGVVNAMFNLGAIYEKGLSGGAFCISSAYRWYRAAAETGDEECKAILESLNKLAYTADSEAYDWIVDGWRFTELIGAVEYILSGVNFQKKNEFITLAKTAHPKQGYEILADCILESEKRDAAFTPKMTVFPELTESSKTTLQFSLNWLYKSCNIGKTFKISAYSVEEFRDSLLSQAKKLKIDTCIDTLKLDAEVSFRSKVYQISLGEIWLDLNRKQFGFFDSDDHSDEFQSATNLSRLTLLLEKLSEIEPSCVESFKSTDGVLQSQLIQKAHEITFERMLDCENEILKKIEIMWPEVYLASTLAVMEIDATTDGHYSVNLTDLCMALDVKDYEKFMSDLHQIVDGFPFLLEQA